MGVDPKINQINMHPLAESLNLQSAIKGMNKWMYYRVYNCEINYTSIDGEIGFNYCGCIDVCYYCVSIIVL